VKPYIHSYGGEPFTNSTQRRKPAESADPW
jgi:hypothetical protein